MGSYGIGVGRLFGCLAEEYCDDKGLCWPPNIAPCTVALLSIGKSDHARDTCELVYERLTQQGLEVLFDERIARPGVMFNDADLRGLPMSVTISDRTRVDDEAEFKVRATEEQWRVPLGNLVEQVVASLEHLGDLHKTKSASITQSAESSGLYQT